MIANDISQKNTDQQQFNEFIAKILELQFCKLLEQISKGSISSCYISYLREASN